MDLGRLLAGATYPAGGLGWRGLTPLETRGLPWWPQRSRAPATSAAPTALSPLTSSRIASASTRTPLAEETGTAQP